MVIKPILKSILKQKNILLRNSFLIQRNTAPISLIQYRPMCEEIPYDHIRSLIGDREVVGYGINGMPGYFDFPHFPFPAIRFSNPTSEFVALREKEKGDWRLLTIKEKKELYRFNFCQTYTEFLAPTGEWMYIVGWGLILISFAIWIFIFQKVFILSQLPIPLAYSDEYGRAQCKRMLQIRVNPITGISSLWDYENMKWKKKPWSIPWENPFENPCE